MDIDVLLTRRRGAMKTIASRPIAAFVASAALAGTCLAAPGLALADEPAAASLPSASASADQTAGVTCACAGVQITVPEDFDVVELGNMLLASNADGTIVATIVPSGAEDAVPAAPEEWGAYFLPIVESTAEDMGGEYADGGVYTLADGTKSYVYSIAYEQDGIQAILVQCFIPMADGSFVMVQIACDSSDAALVELADDISETIVLASDDTVPSSDDASTAASAAGDIQVVQAGGIEFDLPAGYVPDASSTEAEPAWTSADGTVYVSLMPGLLDEYSTVGDEALDLLATMVVSGLGGSAESSTVLSGDVDVHAYVFTFSMEGEAVAGILGMVVLPDDTVTGVLALTPMENAPENDAEVTALFESIRLA